MSASRTFALWLGVLAAPVAWAVQLVAGYALEDFGCSPGGGNGTVAGFEPATLALVVTAAALAVALLGGLAALVTWRAEDSSAAQYVRFLGLAAVLGSGLLALTILLSGAGIVALTPCEAA